MSKGVVFAEFVEAGNARTSSTSSDGRLRRDALRLRGEMPARFRPAFVALFAAVEGIALQKASGNADDETAEAVLGTIFDAVAPTIVPEAENA